MDAAEALLIAQEETQARRSMIQGFLYGKTHVVRDVLRHTDEQTLYSKEQDGDNYDDAHAAMMRAVNLAKARIIINQLSDMGFEVVRRA